MAEEVFVQEEITLRLRPANLHAISSNALEQLTTNEGIALHEHLSELSSTQDPTAGAIFHLIFRYCARAPS